MTMQVGMIGNNGIVLASDTRITCEPAAMTSEKIGRAIRCASASSKMEFSDNGSIVISCAEDVKSARMVAQHIIADLTADELSNPELIPDAIARIAENALSRERQRIQCLILLADHGGLLYRLQVGKVGRQWKAECEPCLDRGLAGDVTNPAIYLAERYHCELLSVEQLVPLAAQLIISAHLANPALVDGLEIVVCKDSEISRVSPERAQELRRKAKELDNTIRNLILEDRNEGE